MYLSLADVSLAFSPQETPGPPPEAQVIALWE